MNTPTHTTTPNQPSGLSPLSPNSPAALTARVAHAQQAALAPEKHGADYAIWDGMLAHLRKTNPTICRQWFTELEPLGIASGALQLRSKSVLHRNYLRQNCAEPFNDAARTVTGVLLSVKFLGPEDEPDKAPPTTITPRVTTKPTPRVNERAQQQVRRISPTSAPANPTPAPTHQTQSHFNQPTPTQPRAVPRATPVLPPDYVPPHQSHPNPYPHTHSQSPSQFIEPKSQHTPQSLQAPSIHTSNPRPEQSLPLEAPRKARALSNSLPDAYESLTVNPDYSFDTFVKGPGNELALAAALAIVDHPGRKYNPFFIHGGVGLGKTHLLQAICLKLVENNPRTQLYYTSCEGFITQFLECVQSGEMSQFRHRFRDIDVLVIDDIHFLSSRERSQEEFFHTFNALYYANKQIIVSSDAPPEDIPALEERLISRFKWGLVTRVGAPDFETRAEILKTKARIRGMELSREVAEFIAHSIDTNIRELEGAIVKLQILASVENRPIDLAMVQEAIGRPRPQEPKTEVTIQAIIGVVADYFQIRLSDMQSKQRQRSIALPRQVCMYLARRCTRLSLEEIGGFFGGRDHTTVLHAIRTVEDKIARETDFNTVMRSLEDRARAVGGSEDRQRPAPTSRP